MPERAGQLLGGGPLLFVHAHPDDESINTGATMALAVGLGQPVTLVTCTRGERGEVIPAELEYLEGDGPALALWREHELATAMAALGVTDHRFLGAPERRYQDSGMAYAADGTVVPAPDTPAAGFARADLDAAARDLLAVAAEVGAAALVSYDPQGGYGHPDHVRAHQVTMRAAGLAPGPRVYWITAAGADGALPVDADARRRAKVAALRAHATQLDVAPDGSDFGLSNGVRRPVTGIEWYRRVR